MVDQSLADTVLTMIRSEANNNPAPVGCTIKQSYTGYADIILSDGTVIRSVKCLGDNTKGKEAVLVFLNGEYGDMLVVSPSSSSGGSITVDDALSGTSVNPVQNKVINTALGGKVDKESGKGLFSGSYADLTNKPSIPEAYVHPSSKQCDYSYSHPSAKQCDATIPTKTSDLTNDGDGVNPFVTSVPSLTPSLVYECTSFTSYIKSSGATNRLMLYKLDDLYFLRYFITTNTLTSKETEYNMNDDQIASDYRPVGDRTFHVATSSNHNAKIIITTNGKIKISTDTDSTAISLAGTCTYWW